MVMLLLVYGAVVPGDMVVYPKANSVMARVAREAWEQQQRG
ncbi:hypothetical protein A1F94_011929 [Pyrenophora tritici-repentis]|nr:hypothetical protein A1F94_011929 [Pyrenophora tritici-repentis]KAI0582574.1 hypothetical protein Alg130_06066 [Pyrenophora tritici-repentis]